MKRIRNVIKFMSQFGRVFNIQKFSVHDGPGIRDLVFLKGCPLRCQWCSNPESQNTNSEIGYIQSKCISVGKCGYCLEACPNEAMAVSQEGFIDIKRDRCNHCGKCVEVCPAKAITLFGALMTVQDVLNVVEEQAMAWRASGGVTISGGEPLLQADFAQSLLKECKKKGIETAIETSGYAPWPDVEQVCQYCDLIYFDVKCMDPEKHKKFTGVDNRLILDNLQKISVRFPKTPVIVRTPIIPDFNDTEEDVFAISEYIKRIENLADYELMPYHAFGQPKYEQLGREYLLEHLTMPKKEYTITLNQKVRAALNLRQFGNES